jgi:hypothetical protein
MCHVHTDFIEVICKKGMCIVPEPYMWYTYDWRDLIKGHEYTC